MTEPVRSAKDVLIAAYVRADKSRSINDVVDDQLKELVRQGYLIVKTSDVETYITVAVEGAMRALLLGE
jgi:hypothetical protein